MAAREFPTYEKGLCIKSIFHDRFVNMFLRRNLFHSIIAFWGRGYKEMSSALWLEMNL